LAERGFFAKEMNVGWKEWTQDRLPIHHGESDGDRCQLADSPAATP